jgi:hypothetical protein
MIYHSGWASASTRVRLPHKFGMAPPCKSGCERSSSLATSQMQIENSRYKTGCFLCMLRGQDLHLGLEVMRTTTTFVATYCFVVWTIPSPLTKGVCRLVSTPSQHHFCFAKVVLGLARYCHLLKRVRFHRIWQIFHKGLLPNEP